MLFCEIDGYLVQSIAQIRFIADNTMRSDTWENDGNGCATPNGTLYRELALMEFDEFRDDGEPESSASSALGARRVGTIEGFKNPEQVFAGDADTAVLHDELDMVIRRRLHRYAYMASARRVAERIFDEIACYLLERRRVAPHLCVRTFAECHLLFAASREEGEFLHDIGRDCGEVDGREIDALGAHHRGKR